MVLHFLLPFVLAAIVYIHLALLHIDQTSVYKNVSGNMATTTKLLPLSLFRDVAVSFLLFTAFFLLAVLSPELVSHPDNFTQAEPSITPKHIVPE